MGSRTHLVCGKHRQQPAGCRAPQGGSLQHGTSWQLGDQFEPWDPHRGWQCQAASRMESWWMHEFVFPRMDESARALVLSLGGAGVGLVLRACPTCRLTRLGPQHFRVLFLRRLQLLLPFSVHSCRCGRPIDQFGHHRAACARAGILGKKEFALESARKSMS